MGGPADHQPYLGRRACSGRIEGHCKTRQLLPYSIVQIHGCRPPGTLFRTYQLTRVALQALLLFAKTVIELDELADIAGDAPDTRQLPVLDNAAETGDIGELP